MSSRECLSLSSSKTLKAWAQLISVLFINNSKLELISSFWAWDSTQHQANLVWMSSPNEIPIPPSPLFIHNHHSSTLDPPCSGWIFQRIWICHKVSENHAKNLYLSPAINFHDDGKERKDLIQISHGNYLYQLVWS